LLVRVLQETNPSCNRKQLTIFVLAVAVTCTIAFCIKAFNEKLHQR
jgi:hypothetical protein